MARLAFLAALLWPVGGTPEVVELHSSTWTLTNSNGSISVEVANATNTHLNLMQAGVLQGDPYYRDNELSWNWVANETWTYNTSFASTAEMLARTSQVLRCQVDTVSTVFLNGREVGRTLDNFIVSEFDVTGLLAEEGSANTVSVVIYPPLKYAEEQGKKYPYPVPSITQWQNWADGPNPESHRTGLGTYAHRNFVRKTPADFGWDWGPAWLPSGVVGLSLEARSGAVLAGAAVRQRHADGGVLLSVEARVAAVEACGASLAATLRPPGGSSAEIVVARRRLRLAAVGASAERLELRVERPQLWWPAGMGAQPLYELELRLTLANGTRGGGGVLRRRVGLRTAELVQDPVPNGTSFFFRVNGVDVFAKGANFVPSDAFAPRAAENIEWVLRSAKDANMNMLRVWGGGYYQPDEFYDLADELGIMIWQELVFACSLYPRDKAFLALVDEEVEQQALRLHHHASIVIWGGNNEDESALQWFAFSRQNRDLYVADWVELYINTAMPALRRVDPDVAFVDTSPSNGLVSSEPYVKRWGDVKDPRFGDLHYYDRDVDCEEVGHYPRARFVSEHGFQSYPSFQALEPVLAPEDWSRNSSIMFYRQRQGPDGNKQIQAMAERHLRLPPEHAATRDEQREVFDSYIYLTQVQQSRCYETALAQWRRLRSDPEVGTMGVLYWQIDDIWQAQSCSTMDWSGAWRVSHSAVQRSFAPVLASLLVERGQLQAFVTSDLTEEISAELRVELRPWSGGGAHAWFSCSTSVRSGTRLCRAAALQDALRASGCSPRTCFVHLEGSTRETPPRPLSAHAFLTTLKDAELPVAHLNVTAPRKLGPSRASLLVESDAVAVYAWLESEAVVGRFSPNALLLLPGKPVEVEFLGRSDFDLEAWARGLRARSVRDTYGQAPEREHRGPVAYVV